MIFTPAFLTDICNKNNKAGLSVTAFGIDFFVNFINKE